MPFLYVLTRQDLDPVYAGVQGTHAVADLILHGKLEDWNNDYLIVLSVKDEDALKEWCWKLDNRGIHCGKFYEPDINHELTALAIEGNGKLFKRLPLLKSVLK